MYYVVLGLSRVDGEAQRALPAKGHSRVEVSCEINVIDRDRVTGARATGDWLLMVTGHR